MIVWMPQDICFSKKEPRPCVVMTSHRLGWNKMKKIWYDASTRYMVFLGTLTKNGSYIEKRIKVRRYALHFYTSLYITIHPSPMLQKAPYIEPWHHIYYYSTFFTNLYHQNHATDSSEICRPKSKVSIPSLTTKTKSPRSTEKIWAQKSTIQFKYKSTCFKKF